MRRSGLRPYESKTRGSASIRRIKEPLSVVPTVQLHMRVACTFGRAISRGAFP